MARNMYGATSADFTLTSGGRVVPGAVLTLWTARTGGTQVTDLLDRDSVACTTVTSAADGSVVYYGPNNDKTVHWADSGQGARVAIRPVDITGDPPVMSIGTVTTGAAAATLTGTSEAPVLNLTLPTAGANGVNTAAIQDGAVTAEKFAVQPGNLLTANQASGGDTLGDTTGLASAAGATLTRRTDQARSGTGAVLVTATGTAAFDVYVQQDVTSGETYTFLSSVMGGSGSRTLRATVEWYTSGMSYIGQSYGNEMAPPGSWLDAILTVVAPASAAVARVKVAAITTGSVGDSFWIDALSWHKGSGGTWQLPGVPIPGQGAIKANGAVELPGGDFAPEGVVTANPGSTFLQTSGAATVTGMLSWRKATGTGNTGWVAGPEADTGWRDVSGSLEAGFGGSILLRRIGHTVYLSLAPLNVTANATDPYVYAFPAGFQPSQPKRDYIRLNGNPVSMQAIWYGSPRRLQIQASVSNGWAEYAMVSHITTDAWPASLPGSAA